MNNRRNFVRLTRMGLVLSLLGLLKAWGATETVRYWYDDAGRLITVGYVEAITNTAAIGYGYDANGNRTNMIVLGRRNPSDSDSDAMPDVDELAYFGNFGQTGAGDYDSDGLANNLELLYGADPTLGDTDNDGANDYHEWVAGTSPNNNVSLFEVTAITNSTFPVIYFKSFVDRRYTMLGITNLISGTWINVPGAGPRMGIGGNDSMQDTNNPPKGPFYKIRVEKP